VFGLLQVNTARLLDLSIYPILAAQTGAAAVISMMSPAKVAVGCSTVGAPEGAVLRWLLGYGALIVLIVGGLAWLGLLL
jgi:L-lactate permease